MTHKSFDGIPGVPLQRLVAWMSRNTQLQQLELAPRLHAHARVRWRYSRTQTGLGSRCSWTWPTEGWTSKEASMYCGKGEEENDWSWLSVIRNVFNFTKEQSFSEIRIHVGYGVMQKITDRACKEYCAPQGSLVLWSAGSWNYTSKKCRTEASRLLRSPFYLIQNDVLLWIFDLYSKIPFLAWLWIRKGQFYLKQHLCQTYCM